MNAGSQRLWYISRAGQAIGPMTDVELAWLAHEGHLERSDWIWAEGLVRWIRVTDVRGLLPEPFARPIDVPPAREPDRSFATAPQFAAAPFASAGSLRSDPFAAPFAEQPSIEARMRQNMALSPPNTEIRGFESPIISRPAASAARPDRPAPVSPAIVERSADSGWLGSVPPVRPARRENVPPTTMPAPSRVGPPSGAQAAAALSNGSSQVSQTTPAAQWRAQLAVLVVNGVGKALDDLGVRTWNDLLDDTRLKGLAELLYGQLPFVIRVVINQVWGSGQCTDWLYSNLAALRARVISDRRLAESSQPIKLQIETLLTEYLVAAAWPNEIEKRIQTALGHAQAGWSTVVGGLGSYVSPVAGVLSGGKSPVLPQLPAPGE